MPRKPRIPKATDQSAKCGLPALRGKVPISRLRLQEDGQHLTFDVSRYSLQIAGKLSPAIVTMLLELSPIAVVRQDGRNYDVLAGSRLFSIAAFCLDPSTEIPVLVIDKRYARENEDLLKYLDLAVLPLLHTLRGSAHDLYSLFDIEAPRR